MSITSTAKEEIEKCKSDPEYFFKKYVRLITKDGKKVPVEYKQVKFRKDILDRINKKINSK